jgi:Plasmid pRiA4b ORF-3-like protein
MAEAGTHIFRVALRDRPSVHRDVEIASGQSLAKLAEAIVRAFDFEFDHAFGFYPDTKSGAVMRGRPAYELFADMGEATGTQSVRKTRIGDAFREVGQAMTFLFDYGDEWLFRIKLTGLGRKAAKARYPRVLAKAGPSPVQYPDPDDEDEDGDGA